MKNNCSVSKWYHCGDIEKLIKPDEDIPDGFISGRARKPRKIDELSTRVGKEELYNFYIEENHSYADTEKHFNLAGKKDLRYLLTFYGIAKDHHLSSKYTQKTRSHESYIEGGKKSSITQKINWELKCEAERSAWSEKCRISHSNMSDEVRAHKRESLALSMSLKSPEEIDAIKAKRAKSCKDFWVSLSDEERENRVNNQLEKTRETCLNKYGVDYPCMRLEHRMSGNDSAPNREFAKLLEKHGFIYSETPTDDVRYYSREFGISRKSFDFKIGKTLIEIDPSYTHNSTYPIFDREPMSKSYHSEKSKLAVENGYRCIHIFDWDDYDKIITLLSVQDRIYGRECEIRDVDKKTAKDFINKYHTQNYARDSIRIGLFYKDELVSIMTFGKPRYNKNYDYELIRYCSSKNVVGGAEKLFSYFTKNYEFTSIISYCDLSKFTGAIYSKLGFVYKDTKIGKHWYNVSDDVHVTDNLLRQRGFDQLFHENYGKGISNDELMIAHNFVEIFDAGQSRYEFIKH